MSKKTGRPDIFEHSSHTEFLKNLYEYLKENQRGFSYRKFAKKAGFHSSSVLKHAMDGSRKIQDKSVPKFAKALELNVAETKFFELLVHFNQESDSKKKAEIFKEMLKQRSFQKRWPLAKAQFAYFSEWYYPVIRELVSLPDFEEDYEQIAKSLRPSIKRIEVERAIGDMIQLDILKRDKSSKLVPGRSNVFADGDVKPLEIIRFHKNMIQLGSESIERIDSDKRELSTVTISLSEKNWKELKKEIFDFQQELIEKYGSSKMGDDQIYQVNVQAFPVADNSCSSD